MLGNIVYKYNRQKTFYFFRIQIFFYYFQFTMFSYFLFFIFIFFELIQFKILLFQFNVTETIINFSLVENYYYYFYYCMKYRDIYTFIIFHNPSNFHNHKILKKKKNKKIYKVEFRKLQRKNWKNSIKSCFQKILFIEI